MANVLAAVRLHFGPPEEEADGTNGASDPRDALDRFTSEEDGEKMVVLSWTVTATAKERTSWEKNMQETLQVTYLDKDSIAQSVNVSDLEGQDITIEAGNLKGFLFKAAAAEGASLADVAGEMREITLHNMAKYYDMALTPGSQDVTITVSKLTEASGEEGEETEDSVQLQFKVGVATLEEDTCGNAVLTLTILDMQTLLTNLNEALAQVGEEPVEDLAEITGFLLESYMTLSRNDVSHGDDDVIFVEDITLPIEWEETASGNRSIDVKKTSGGYNWADQTIVWTIAVTPGKDTSLAGAALTDTLKTENVVFDGAITVAAVDESYRETYTVVCDGDGGCSVTGGNGELTDAVTISGSKLEYTFPKVDGEGNPLFQEGTAATITVTTRVQDAMFADYFTAGNGSWTIANTAAVAKADEHNNTIRGEASATESIKADFLAKSGKYNGSVSNAIDWTINVQVTSPLTGAVLYDLLPEDVYVEAGSWADAGNGIQFSAVSLTGTSGFRAYAFRFAAEDAAGVIDAAQNLDNLPYPAALFPMKDEYNTSPENLCSALDALALSGDDTLRYLIVIVPDNADFTMRGGQYTFKLSTSIVPGYASEDYETENTVYITWMGSQGFGNGEFEKPVTGIKYTQAAVEKTALTDAASKVTTWTIHANNNRRPMTEVILTDDLTKVLYTDDSNKSSVLLDKDGEPCTDGDQLALYYWVGEETARPDSPMLVQQITGELEDPTVYQTVSTPSYYYHAEQERLYIYVPSMIDSRDSTGQTGETYHFQFQTQGIGSYFYGYDSKENASGGNSVDEPLNMGGKSSGKLTVNQTNTVTLRQGERQVTASAGATYANRYLYKEASAPAGSAYTPADNTMWWKLTINLDGVRIANASITDQLPEGFSYAGTFQLYGASASGDALGAEISGEKNISVSGTKTLEIQLNDLLAEGGRYVIYILTRADMSEIADDLSNALQAGASTVSFANHAWLNGITNSEKIHAFAEGNGSISTQSVTKTGRQVTQNGYYIYEMEWTIDVNQNGVANGYANPTLTDTLPEGATLKTDGVQIYRIDSQGNILAGPLEDLDWTCSGNTFTFHLPNQKTDGTYQYGAYRVVLQTTLAAEVAGTELTNTARLTAHQKFESTFEKGVFYFGVSASAYYWQKPPVNMTYLQVLKVSDTSGSTLAGAAFTVEYLTESLAGNALQDSGWVNTADWQDYDSGKSITTNPEGRFATPVTLPANTTAVRLTEVSVPGGYQMPADPEFVLVFQADGSVSAVRNAAVRDVSVAKETVSQQEVDVVTVTVANTPIPDNALTLRKVSADDPDLPLAGAVFHVEYSTNGITWTDFGSDTYTTDETGCFTLTGLSWNISGLRLTEVEAPGGYLLPQERTTTVFFGDRGPELMDGNPTGAQLTQTDQHIYALTIANVYDAGDEDGGSDPDRDPRPPRDPDRDPGTDLPDEDTPTTDLPDEGTLTTDLPDGDVPTTDLPDEAPPLEDLPDEEPPLADVPATGDTAGLWVLAAGVSGVALVWLVLSGKKRRDGGNNV